MAYAIELAPSFTRDYDDLPAGLQKRVIAAVERLADDPRPAGCKKLRGERSAWRVRVGDYRIVYEVEDRIVRVLVLRVRHRREVYR